MFPKLLERGFLCTSSTSLLAFTIIKLADGLGASPIFELVDVRLDKRATRRSIKHMTDNSNIKV
jgi:hypothetical protein